jgi:perosamine synthetase
VTEHPAVGPSIPYAAHEVSGEDERAVLAALRSDRLAQGPETGRFEEELARAVGAPFAVAASSGTAALHLALAALGVGPGDEVLVPPLSFVATANAVLFCGATPVFADVESERLTLSPAEVAKRIGPRTRGAIAMHYGGHPADADALREALGPGRFLLEDACHALGASLRGRAAGTLGDAACFSFHPAKLITTGEGGAVTTASAELAHRVRRLREHGIEREAARFRGLGLPPELADEERGPWMYEMHDFGPNYRMPELSAALGRSQLARRESFLARRRALAAAYREALAHLEELELPGESIGSRSAWHLYPVRLRRELSSRSRAELFAGLRRRGIGVQVHYIPIHLQPCYRARLGTGFGDCPVAEREYLRLLSLPLFPALAEAELARVARALHEELRGARRS